MLILGLDVGIASIGWALLDTRRGIIIAMGVWIFDPPEDKTQSGTRLRSEARRAFRGQRRVIRRRRQRMGQVRRLLAENGLLAAADRDALRAPACDPWVLRVAGLERKLTPLELAVALGHIARHRGFKSNAKGGEKNSPDDGKMLKASAQTREKLAKFVTPGRALMEDDGFVLRETPRRDGGVDTVRRLRNRDGDYSRSLLRDDLNAEAREIFRAQRRLGMAQATAELERQFLDVAFFQRPLQDSEHMVGSCPFEPDEMRAARRGYSFECFRYLSRLNNLRLTGRGDRPRLSREEIGKAFADFGATAKISFSALRRKLGLPAGVSFEGVKEDEEGKRDVVARSGEAAAGTARLKKLIAGAHGEITWRALADNRPDILDRVAEVISFRNEPASIAKGFAETDLDPAMADTLLKAVGEGALDVFTGAGHISAKAARAIIPGLMDGMTYDKACEAAHYDHTASREKNALEVRDGSGKPVHGKEALARILKEERISRDIVGSPTARKSLIEALKQVKAVVEEHGMPDYIHVELARDVGKSIEEREEIERGIEKRNKQKDKLRVRFAELVGEDPETWRPTADELLKYELWEEQQWRCLYTPDYDKSLIDVNWLRDGSNRVEIDHILPWSAFGDDSFRNKTLCLTGSNRNKKNRTPYDWLKDDPARWDGFATRVNALPGLHKQKRRNLLLQNAEEAAERFRNRNLNDTRWSARLLAEALRQVLPDVDEGRVNEDGEPVKTRRVLTRPGALTDRMRRAWGLQEFKKDKKLKRIPDDRHHALDALIVAAITEKQLQAMTTKMQKEEVEWRQAGRPDRALTKVMAECEPWPGFRDQATTALETLFVARAERRRARGKAHDATIRQIGEKDGRPVVFERKRVADLKKEDTKRIRNPDRNAALIASLDAWIEAGSPKDKPPLSPKGDPITKVKLESKGKVAVKLYRGGPDNPPGTVDRGEMARVDVYTKATPKGVRQYFLVPVYPHEVAALDAPPNRAVTAYKPESEWPVMDESYEFLWSLVPMTLVKVVDKNNTPFFSGKGQVDSNVGYFRGLDRATGAINLSSIVNQTEMKTGIGARTLSSLQKLTVDRLGRTFEVGRETRTWHGKVCT